MSTFNGIIKEFPRVQIDNFRLRPDAPPPLACFLSHIHSDHLSGLDTLHSPFVYCTAATRELLLKLEKYPHRMNFAKGILEARKQTFRKLKRLLKPIPLETPTRIELQPGYAVTVTLFDANHCTGACMFLLEGQGNAVLYTGDVRSEPWWVNNLVRNPVLLPYTLGAKRLDNVYLDTTFAMGETLSMDFPTKAAGLAELLDKVGKYPPDTVFYLNTWTFGYEQVWIALSALLQSKVHLCDYRYRVYSAMQGVQECFGPELASLIGFKLGNSVHEGCLTRDARNARIHSCERGTGCPVFKDKNVVRITPILTRHKGVEVNELGAGGGHGDLNQSHELELNDMNTVALLIGLCSKKLNDQPEVQTTLVQWLMNMVQKGASSIKLDFEGFWDELKRENVDADLSDDMPLSVLVPALARLAVGQSRGLEQPVEVQSKHITFPYSRHSSYNELRCLVEALKPKDVYPCTVVASNWTPAVSMRTLFGDLCPGATFWHDSKMLNIALPQKGQARSPREYCSDSESEEHHRRTTRQDNQKAPDLGRHLEPAKADGAHASAVDAPWQNPVEPTFRTHHAPPPDHCAFSLRDEASTSAVQKPVSSIHSSTPKQPAQPVRSATLPPPLPTTTTPAPSNKKRKRISTANNAPLTAQRSLSTTTSPSIAPDQDQDQDPLPSPSPSTGTSPNPSADDGNPDTPSHLPAPPSARSGRCRILSSGERLARREVADRAARGVDGAVWGAGLVTSVDGYCGLGREEEL